MTDHDPMNRGMVKEIVFDLLDHPDAWYGPDAEIGHVLVVARVPDAGGGRYTDVVTSPSATKDEVLEMMRRAHGIHTRPAAPTGGENPEQRS